MDGLFSLMFVKFELPGLGFDFFLKYKFQSFILFPYP